VRPLRGARPATTPRLSPSPSELIAQAMVTVRFGRPLTKEAAREIVNVARRNEDHAAIERLVTQLSTSTSSSGSPPSHEAAQILNAWLKQRAPSGELPPEGAVSKTRHRTR
jgi:hypothetical protein